MEEILTKDEHFFKVYDFMVNKLHLVGSELAVFSLIFSYSESNRAFNGSKEHISKRTGISTRTVRRAVLSLMEKGLLVKEYDEQFAAAYKIPMDKVSEILTKRPKKKDKTSEKNGQNCSPAMTKRPKKADKTSPNTKRNTYINTKADKKRTSARASTKKVKLEKTDWNNPAWVQSVFDMAIERSINDSGS